MTTETKPHHGLPLRSDDRGGLTLHVVDQAGALVALRSLAVPKLEQGYRVVGVVNDPMIVRGTTGLGIELATDDDRPSCRFGLLLHESTPDKHVAAIAFLNLELLGQGPRWARLVHWLKGRWR